MKISDIFEIRNGIASTGLTVYPSSRPDCVPYLRPANRQHRTIAGWVPRSEVGQKNIYPRETLFISTDGEGSHSYSYVSQFEFAPNSNVAVLIPNIELNLKQKIFIARCITLNRFRFSYGRKPKGDRLKSILLPDFFPDWLDKVQVDDLWQSLEKLESWSEVCADENHEKTLQSVPLSEIFCVNYGNSLELNRLKKIPHSEGGIPFVSRTSGNNGVSAYVEPLDNISPIPKGVLSCALGGNVLSTFLQMEPFYSGRDLAFLTPKSDLTTEELLFYCTAIQQNKHRFSYGRQANRTLKELPIPSRESIPNWVHGSLSRVAKRIKPDH